VVAIRAGLLALRVRMFSSQASQLVDDIRDQSSAFPGFPSDRRYGPRLQLRGSAGFSPASQSWAGTQDTRTKVGKEQRRNDPATSGRRV